MDSLKVSGNEVSCRRYTKDKFAEEMKLHPAMLPLFAAVVGNDAVPDADLRKIQKHIFKTHPPNPNSTGTNYKHALIKCIGAFLATFGDQVEKALAEIERVLSLNVEKPKEKWGETDDNDDGAEPDDELLNLDGTVIDYPAEAKRIRAVLTAGMKLYDVSSEVDPNSKTSLVPGNPEDWTGGVFPPWLLSAYRAGDFDYKAMLVLVRHRFWCHGLIENLERPSAYIPSRLLRQYVYGILFKTAPSVVELVRLGPSPTTPLPVGPSISLSASKAIFGPVNVEPVRSANGTALPHLSEIHALSADARKNLLHSILGIAKEQLQALAACPPHLTFPLMLLNWWVRTSSEPVPVFDIAAIVAGLVANVEAQAEVKPPNFSKNAAHLCAIWTTLIEAGNLLVSVLQGPVSQVSPAVALDGVVIHRLFDGLRKHKDTHTVIATSVTSVESFWLLFQAATAGVRSKLEGDIGMNEENRIVVTKIARPIAVLNAAAQAAKDVPRDARGRPFDAAVRKAHANDGKAKEKVGTIFNALKDLDIGDDDAEEAAEPEPEPEPEPTTAAPAASKKDSKKKPAPEKSKKTGVAEVDDLLAQFDSMDAAKQKKEEAKKAKEKAKRDAKKAAAAAAK